jgi:hypothetical protein
MAGAEAAKALEIARAVANFLKLFMLFLSIQSQKSGF